MTKRTTLTGFDVQKLVRDGFPVAGYSTLAKAVIPYIANLYHSTRGYAYISISTLAWELDISVPSARRAIQEIEKTGTWQIVRGGPTPQGNRATRFYPNFPLLNELRERANIERNKRRASQEHSAEDMPDTTEMPAPTDEMVTTKVDEFVKMTQQVKHSPEMKHFGDMLVQEFAKKKARARAEAAFGDILAADVLPEVYIPTLLSTGKSRPKQSAVGWLETVAVPALPGYLAQRSEAGSFAELYDAAPLTAESYY